MNPVHLKYESGVLVAVAVIVVGVVEVVEVREVKGSMMDPRFTYIITVPLHHLAGFLELTD
jgi:hypothetical protein